MATLYSVRNWIDLYENAGSRKIAGALDWFPLPTKHDGLSFRRLMARPDSMELYGAWVLILSVAAKCKPRGTLSADDAPLTAGDIALKTGAAENVIHRALQLFSCKEFGWLSGSVLPDRPDEVVLQDRTGQDRISNSSDPIFFTNPSLSAARNGSGFSKNQFTDLTPELLADRNLLRRWFDGEAKRKDGWVNGSESDWRNVTAVAAKVLNSDGIADPVAVAKWIIRRRKWEHLSATHEELARAASREFASSPTDPIVAALAAAFAAKVEVE